MPKEFLGEIVLAVAVLAGLAGCQANGGRGGALPDLGGPGGDPTVVGP